MVINIEFEPNKIVAEFLRVNVPEIERVDFPDRQVDTNELLSGTGGQTVFPLSDRLWAVKEVRVASVVQTKYVDYAYSLRNGTITFATAPPSAVDNIEVDYITGTTSWIFPDHPRGDLKEASYPRISIVPIDESQEVMGIFDDQTWDSLTFQVDTWAREDERITFNGEQFANQDVCDLLARQVQQAIRENWRTQLVQVLFYPIKITQLPMPFDDKKGVYQTTSRYTMKAFDAGEYTGV